MDNKEPKIKSPNEVTLDDRSYPKSPEPTSEYLPAESKPKKRIGLGIMLTVFVLLLVGGALALGYLWGNDNPKNMQRTSNSTVSNNDSGSTSSDQTEDSSSHPAESTGGGALSISEAEKILEKYIGEGNYIQAQPLNAFYSTFSSKFDEEQKAFLTYGAIDRSEEETVACTNQWYERGQCTGKSISYELMSERYKSLFGDYGSIKKENYAFHDFFYLVYDDNTNAYKEFILPGGGTTSIVAMHKMVDVEKSGNDVIATLTFATINTEIEESSDRGSVVREPGSSPIATINLPTSTVDEITNSMAIYEFTLSPYNDTYVLTAVRKIES